MLIGNTNNLVLSNLSGVDFLKICSGGSNTTYTLTINTATSTFIIPANQCRDYFFSNKDISYLRVQGNNAFSYALATSTKQSIQVQSQADIFLFLITALLLGFAVYYIIKEIFYKFRF